MKITHILPALTKGGAERVAADLASQAASVGHEVTIIAAWPVDPAYLRDALHSDVRVWYVSDAVPSRVGVYFNMCLWLWRYQSELAEQDILHCHLTYGEVFGTAVHLLRRLFGARRPVIVGTCHSVGMPVPTLLRWVHARLAAGFDAFALMAEDDYWCSFIRARPALLSAVIPNGISFKGQKNVEPSVAVAYRREVGIPDECQYVVGTVGRLHPDRKPWLYLPIFTEIVREFGTRVHFVIAGGGPEYDHMRALVAKQGLEKQVHLPGLVLDPRFPLSIMDVYVTINVGAVTGIAGLEAAYTGLPVIAIQLLPSYIAKPDDWIWSSTNPSEVAAKVMGLIHNPTERQALGVLQAARVRSHFTVEAMANSYDELYRAAIEQL